MTSWTFIVTHKSQTSIYMHRSSIKYFAFEKIGSTFRRKISHNSNRSYPKPDHTEEVSELGPFSRAQLWKLGVRILVEHSCSTQLANTWKRRCVDGYLGSWQRQYISQCTAGGRLVNRLFYPGRNWVNGLSKEVTVYDYYSYRESILTKLKHSRASASQPASQLSQLSQARNVRARVSQPGLWIWTVAIVLRPRWRILPPFKTIRQGETGTSQPGSSSLPLLNERAWGQRLHALVGDK